MKRRIVFFTFILIFNFFSLSLRNIYVYATSSVDYIVDPENSTNSGTLESSSADYIVRCQQVGDLAIGESVDSEGNIIQHGFPCPPENLVILNFVFNPQGRYGPPLTNDQTNVTIEVRPVGGDLNSFIFSQEVTTDGAGSYSNLILTGVTPGTYDVTAKGWATLRVKKININFIAGANFIDFTDAGVNKATAGDVDLTDRSGIGSDEKGDNEINAADYSVLVGNYNLTGPAYDRIDLDQYGLSASAADYSLLVTNYNLVGSS